MTTYRNIHGRSIQAVTTDPTGDITEGQIWYNTTSDTFKTVLLSEAWASSGSTINTRSSHTVSGTQTANLIAGGATPPSSTNIALGEEYNGSGWSAGGSLNTARRGGGGAGTQTAGLSFGGYTTTAVNNSEEYDGTSWTEGNNLNTARSGLAGSGTQTAGLAAGSPNATEEYDGTSWTSGNNTTDALSERTMFGVQTSSVIAGGTPPVGTEAEQYDGTTWTAITSFSTARQRAGAAGVSSSDGIIYGGFTAPGPATNTTEKWDGSSWTSKSTMGTGSGEVGYGPSGTSSAALSAAGATAPGSRISNTEEFSASVNVVTGSAWSSGTAPPGSVKMTFAGTGTQSAYLKSSGNDGSPAPNPYSNATQEYDGSSWTSAPNVPYESRDPDSSGVQTAALQFGGQSGSIVSTSVAYNGSSWTSAPSMNHVRRQVTGSGAQTTTITAGGSGPPSGSPEGAMTNTESYNGSSWSNETALPTGLRGGGQLGVESACLRFGGAEVSPETGVTTVYQYDGSSWTTAPSLNVGRRTTSAGGAGTTTAALVYGGGTSPSIPVQTGSERFDGTSFVTDAALATLGNCRGTPNSPSTTGVAAFGTVSSTQYTEEFTEGTSSINVKTLTQS